MHKLVPANCIENVQFIHSFAPSVNTLFTFMFIELTLANIVTSKLNKTVMLLVGTGGSDEISSDLTSKARSPVVSLLLNQPLDVELKTALVWTTFAILTLKLVNLVSCPQTSSAVLDFVSGSLDSGFVNLWATCCFEPFTHQDLH